MERLARYKFSNMFILFIGDEEKGFKTIPANTSMPGNTN